uniref:Putative reverse transcriptase domain-containing protein n=1 Tax=Tanacetum cinerariifolium TaxID=118510 RepID=A0A6L2JCM4_TANCI|nr:putative reverse transcriptase domain-containing protein [Tanacetum cinerariifolium]
MFGTEVDKYTARFLELAKMVPRLAYRLTNDLVRTGGAPKGQDSRPYLDKLVIMFIDDILTYSCSKAEHEQDLNTISSLLKDHKLYAEFSKCEFWLQEVQFLGDVVIAKGIHVHPAKIRAINKCEAAKTPT